MAQLFTGFQYLLIDAANNFGLDKELFEDRIEWATVNLASLESLAPLADTPSLYLKAVFAIRKAQAGIPTGHLVGLDAVCSGLQVMSALTGCIVGATNTGLVNPNVRADAYSTCTDTMATILGNGFTVSRAEAKDALMTTLYGSTAKPKEIFGEDTPEYFAFHKATKLVAPGAMELLQDLLDTWQPFALAHSWKLPDGFDAVVRVMTKKESRVEVDELDHSTFTYEYKVNEGKATGLSNVANVVHSVDGYILRSMHRRCNYDTAIISKLAEILAGEIVDRARWGIVAPTQAGSKLAYYIEQYERSTLVDIVIAPYINECNVNQMSIEHITKLLVIVEGMLSHKPFPIITVHDEFKAHANNMNQVRLHYREIFADVAESNLLDDLLSQLHGEAGTFTKLSNNLGSLIRQSNYALA